MSAVGTAFGALGLKLGRMTPELLRKAVARYRKKHPTANAKTNQILNKKYQTGKAFLKDVDSGYVVDIGKKQAILGGKPVLVDDSNKAKPMLNALSPASPTSNFETRAGSEMGRQEKSTKGEIKHRKQMGKPMSKEERANAMQMYGIVSPQGAKNSSYVNAVTGQTMKAPQANSVKFVNGQATKENAKTAPNPTKPVIPQKVNKSKEYAAVHSDFFGS